MMGIGGIPNLFGLFACHPQQDFGELSRVVGESIS